MGHTMLLVGLVAIAASGCGGNPTSPTPHEPEPVPETGAVVPATQSGSLYVAGTGSDAADGRTPETALRTVAERVRRVQPGETVRILSGVYNESITTTLVGTPAARLAIVGEWGRAVLAGNHRLATGIWCEECRHVTFDNLTFRDYSDIWLVIVLSDDIRIANVTVHDNGFAPTIGWAEG